MIVCDHILVQRFVQPSLFIPHIYLFRQIEIAETKLVYNEDLSFIFQLNTSDVNSTNNVGNSGLLGEIFNVGSAGPFVTPKALWLPAEKGKGLEIYGTFSRRNGHIYMDMSYTNKAMQAMSGFAIQLNKNRYWKYIADEYV